MKYKKKLSPEFKTQVALDAIREYLRGCRTESQIRDLADHLPQGMSYKRFCEEMQIPKSTGYYKPKGESQLNIDIM